MLDIAEDTHYHKCMIIAVWSLLGLVSLVILSYITTFAFHIRSDEFYNYFHLAAGILAMFFFYSLTTNFLLSILLTELIGIIWEVYEWLEWKIILKKKKYQPQPDDTKNDLVLDFVGSLVGVVALVLWLGKQ